MELPDPDAAGEDAMDSFLEKFQSQPYRGGFHEDQWEEEFEKVPLFMKKAPSEIDPNENPDLACLQSIIFDEERSPEEQAKTYKDEGNDYFKEKDYKKAVISYTEGLKKKCTDPDLNAVLYTNRAAAQYYLGNFRSALNDVTAARKLKPCHLKAIVRGALCHLELKNFAEAVNWCDEGLQIDAREKKLLEMRAKADMLKRTEQRDIRKAKLKEKKEQNQNEALLQAIKVYFEDEDGTELYRVPLKSTLLQVLQHPRYFVKALTPAFLVCVGSSAFCRNYLQGRKVHQVK
ncbi:tetratricopeptide repeat protein 4 isoform X3 [Neomonachus schauinslandi]|uniref:Tetratricopeptide repeat protein 4 isoform X3 n=1 Tax=Neomonachus schauinslandi TaxID=29088 RepID=A0A8M1M9J9_NEOSC|nr:tetratricopeptide repeat protein 4 isoform X3 [Neomonachus schauinslandi]